MAERHPDVAAAYKAFFTPLIDAQVFLELFPAVGDAGHPSLAILAEGIFQRLLEAWDELEHELHKHGFPPAGAAPHDPFDNALKTAIGADSALPPAASLVDSEDLQ